MMVLASAIVAARDHRQRVGQRQLQHLDVLALVGDARRRRHAARAVVRRGEEVQALGHRPGRHVHLEQRHDRADRARRSPRRPRAGSPPPGRSPSSSPAGASISIPSGWPFAYAGQRNCRVSRTVPAARVAEQDHRAVAAVVGLAADPRPAPVAAAPVERRLAQDVPVVGQDLDRRRAARADLRFLACSCMLLHEACAIWRAPGTRPSWARRRRPITGAQRETTHGRPSDPLASSTSWSTPSSVRSTPQTGPPSATCRSTCPPSSSRRQRGRPRRSGWNATGTWS